MIAAIYTFSWVSKLLLKYYPPGGPAEAHLSCLPIRPGPRATEPCVFSRGQDSATERPAAGWVNIVRRD